MTTVFYGRPDGRFIEITSNIKRKNFIERIKAPVFLDAVLAIEMQEHQFHLEKKQQCQHLKR